MISFRIGNNRLIFYVDFLGLLLFPRIYPYLHTLLSPELIILTINLKRVAGLLPPSYFSCHSVYKLSRPDFSGSSLI